MPSPSVSYAQRDGINIAYQVVGDGPVDLVLINGLAAHMDLFWLEPEATAMLRRLGSFARLIMFDKPGTGLSDPVTGPPTLDQRTADVAAVMDAAGSTKAFLLGYSEGAFAAAMFAATYPERCHGLILLSACARWIQDHDSDWDYNEETMDVWQKVDATAYADWGSGDYVLLMAPSWRASPVHRRTVGVFERAAASPGMAKALLDSMRNDYDMRSVLPTIRVPTLVLHAEGEYVPISLGRDLADRIPGARFVALAGADHIPFARDWRQFAAEVEGFVTGEHVNVAPDRVLRTILFIDIVGSTPMAAQLGDDRWGSLLDRHEQITQQEIDGSGGQLIDRTGDGLLATFESPSRAIRCARQIGSRLADELGLEIRAGLHAAEIEARGDTILGIGVHVAARIQSSAAPGEVVVSAAVRDLVAGSGIDFVDKGTHELKGVPGLWALHAVAGDTPAGARPVSSARSGESVVTPTADAMTTVDRLAVRLARHAPGLSRTTFRLAARVRRD